MGILFRLAEPRMVYARVRAYTPRFCGLSIAMDQRCAAIAADASHKTLADQKKIPYRCGSAILP
jgi:hypothetical protein